MLQWPIIECNRRSSSYALEILSCPVEERGDSAGVGLVEVVAIGIEDHVVYLKDIATPDSNANLLLSIFIVKFYFFS